MLRQIHLVAFLFLTSIGFSQIQEVRRITEKLCSPEFHGRGYVNKGDSVAAAFLASEFDKAEVQPLGKSYFQPFQLDVNTFPGEMMVEQKRKLLIPGRDFVVNPSSTGVNTTYKLHELTASELLDLEGMRALLQRIKNDPSVDKAIVIDYTLMSTDTVKLVQSLAYELATILPVIECIDTKFTWSVGREQIFYPFLQIQAGSFDKSGDLKVNIEASFVKNYQSQNVIAHIPAKKKCAKTIVFTAHYDHLGRMGRDTHFPGANDNASGTAMLITLAKYFKKNPVDYNVVFIAFAGEEAGLVGSKYFVENPLLKLKKIKFLVNLDIMGSGEEGITVVNATEFKDEFSLLQTINKEKNLLAQVKSRGPSANSDHHWFTEKGVPAFFIYTMGTNKHYHDIFDTYEELTFNEYEDITTLLIEFVKRM